MGGKFLNWHKYLIGIHYKNPVDKSSTLKTLFFLTVK